MRVEHERDVHPSGPCPHVREVRDPQLVRAQPCEVAVNEVGRSGLPRLRIDRTLASAANHASDPQLPHETFDRAAGDVVPVAAQPKPQLARAEDLALLLPRGQDDRLPPLIRHRPRRLAAPSGGVVRRWGDLHAMLGQHRADRLDTPSQPAVGALPVLVDEDDYLLCGRSSSAAKKADAAFKISFA